jgi:hypothetical protein
VEGPDAAGGYTVRYRPTAEQVNLTGTTEAELVISDLAGHRHVEKTEFLTP